MGLDHNVRAISGRSDSELVGKYVNDAMAVRTDRAAGTTNSQLGVKGIGGRRRHLFLTPG